MKRQPLYCAGCSRKLRTDEAKVALNERWFCGDCAYRASGGTAARTPVFATRSPKSEQLTLA